jgi:hypothetical protein
MSEQSTQQPASSPTASEPATAPEPTPAPPDEPMFPLPKMDFELRHGLHDTDGD